jgi:hypothetical protein
MEKQIYISLVLALNTILFGFLIRYSEELIIILLPFVAFIYMAFNFNTNRSTFIVMWLILASPLFIFYINDISYMIFHIIYQFIYLSILILFILEEKSQNTNNTKNIKNLSKSTFLLHILMPGIIIGIALFWLLIYLIG